MAIETTELPVAEPTPETDHFLETLQADQGEVLGWEQELGLRVKGVLAARAAEFAKLGFFAQIGDWDADSRLREVHGEESELDEPPSKPGIFIHTEDSGSGYPEEGVVMEPSGTLLHGNVKYASDYEHLVFGFDTASEVPLEDYPRYLAEAFETMKDTVDEETGVHARQYKEARAKELADRIQGINDDNQKYGVERMEFEATPSFPEIRGKALEFMEELTQMREKVRQGRSGITPQQFENLLGHMLVAQEYGTSEGNPLDNFRYGAVELELMASSLISGKVDPNAGNFDPFLLLQLHYLFVKMRHEPSGSAYLVRRTHRIPYSDVPENERIYSAMASNYIDRLHAGAKLGDEPNFNPAPPLEYAVDREGNTISKDEIVDWLLNTSVAGLVERRKTKVVEVPADLRLGLPYDNESDLGVDPTLENPGRFVKPKANAGQTPPPQFVRQFLPVEGTVIDQEQKDVSSAATTKFAGSPSEE